MTKLFNHKTIMKKLPLFGIAFILVFSLCVQSLSLKPQPLTNAEGFVGNITEITGAVDPLSTQHLKTDESIKVFKPDDELTVIVSLNERSLVEEYNPNEFISVRDFARSKKGQRLNNSIIDRHSAIKKSLKREFDIKFRDTYTVALNGFSATVKYKDIKNIEKINGIKSVMISEVYAEPQADSMAEGITNPVKVFDSGIYDTSESGYDGTGTLVAVFDTGLDYTHPAFQTMPDPDKLALDKEELDEVLPSLSISESGGFVRVQDVYLNDKVPFAFDYTDKVAEVFPVNMHGTHVAGIIGGQDTGKVLESGDTFRGAAPGAQLAIFKVFSSKTASGATTADILAGLNDAALIGVDVINLSLGATSGFATENDLEGTDRVYENLRNAGISVVVSAGNESSSTYGSEKGSTNLVSNPDSGTIGSPGSYDQVLTVASIDGIKSDFFVANGDITGYIIDGMDILGKRTPFVPRILDGKNSAEIEYVSVPGLGNSVNYNTVNVEGKIALVKRGTLNFEDKIKYARLNGAIGIIIYNNVSGTFSMAIGKETDIPSCSITKDIGDQMAASASGTIAFSTEYKAGPFISGFSSWGVTPDLDIKPEITAHGGYITSSVPGSIGYDVVSGTSMSSPNMAGVVAIFKQVLQERNPNASRVEINTLLNRLIMSTATIAINEDGNPYSPRKQGAGLASLSNAINSNAYIYVEGRDKTKLALGDDPKKTGIYTLNFSVKNLSATAKTFRVLTDTMTESVTTDLKNVNEHSYMLDSASVQISSSNAYANGDLLTVGGYAVADVEIVIKLADSEKQYIDKHFVNGMYVEGFARLIPLNPDLTESGGVELSVPWLSFYGDWTVAPLFDATAYEVAESAQNLSILDEDKLRADVRGSILYSAFYTGRSSASGNDEEDMDGYWGLGEYCYPVGDEYIEPYISEDKSSITQYPYGNFEFAFVALGTLRGAKQADIKIVDTVTGEIIIEKTVNNVRKAGVESAGRQAGFLEARVNALDNNLPNNRKYDVFVNGRLDYGDGGVSTNLKNTFKSSFYVDSEAPALVADQTELRVVDNSGIKEYYLDLNLYDNHYLQACMLGTYGSIDSEAGQLINASPFQSYMRPIDSRLGATTKVSYNITKFWNEIIKNDGKLFLEVVDYAKNISQYTFDIPQKPADSLSFKLGSTTKNLDIGQTADLKRDISLTPQDAWANSIEWTSSNPLVAEVSSGAGKKVLINQDIEGAQEEITIPAGTVTAIGQGSAVITATSKDKDGNPLTASITINVSNLNYTKRLEGLSLDKNLILTDQGSTGILTASVVPWNMSDIVDLSWESGDPERVMIEKLTPLTARYTVLDDSAGNINVKVMDATKLISATCEFKIHPKYDITGSILEAYYGKGGVVQDNDGNIIEEGVVDIPSDRFIVYIASESFDNNPYIKKVIIPEGVTTIMARAFENCTALTEVVLPSTLKTIEENAFAGCGALEKINLNKVEFISARAFMGTRLTSANLSSAVFIGDHAFSAERFFAQSENISVTSFSEADLSNAKYIGNYAFAGNIGLYSLTLSASNIGYGAFSGCTNLTTVSFTNNVTIGYQAFYWCTSLKTVNFYAGADMIGSEAFMDCWALEEISLPAGMKTIGYDAFARCYKLETITLSAGTDITLFSDNIFGGSGLKEFKVQAGSQSYKVNDGILYDITQTKIIMFPSAKTLTDGIFDVPSNVTAIGDAAFSGAANLKRINLNNVEEIGNSAFSLCQALEYVDFNSALVSIGNYAFYECSVLGLANLNSASNLSSIGEGAFYYSGSSAESYALNLSGSITFVGTSAFSRINSLTSVSLTNVQRLEKLPNSMFEACGNLETVAFYLIPTSGNPGIQEVGDYAFADCAKITSMSLPSTIKRLGEGIFYGCTRLNAVSLPNALTEIPDMAFAGSGLISLNISSASNIKAIGFGAFYDANEFIGFTGVGLQNITFIDTCAFSFTKIEEFVAPSLINTGTALFNDYTYSDSNEMEDNIYLKTVSIPSAVYIGSQAFRGCVELTSVDISSVKFLGAAAFLDCVKLDAVSMPNVEIIGSRAFYNTAITAIALGSSLTKLYENAFENMPELASITISQNSTYFLDNGALYSILPSGGYQLEKYPEGKTNLTKFVVLDGTKRIAPSAFERNKSLTEVTLARTLLSIGNASFNLTNIKKYVFLSPVMPVLEGYIAYNETDGVHVPYLNFTGRLGVVEGLEMLRPANGVGYDSFIMRNYFDKVELSANAMTDDTVYVVSLIDALPKTITLEDFDAINTARELFNNLNEVQKSMVSNIEKLKSAENELSILLIEAEIADLIAKIDALPLEPSLSDRDAVNALLDRFNALSEADRERVSNRDKLFGAESAILKLENGSNLVLILIIIFAIVAVLGGGVATVLLIKKKRSAKHDA